jgi:hypothetical protein
MGNCIQRLGCIGPIITGRDLTETRSVPGRPASSVTWVRILMASNAFRG